MAIAHSECFELSNAEIRELNYREPICTSRAEFEEALIKLGFFSGIKVVVHSSLSSLGHFEGGAENCCHALMHLVTEKGTLLMPELTIYPNDGDEFIYDSQNTPCRVGAIPECFRHLPGVVRSFDPTHSFCAWGQHKVEYVRNHHKFPTMHAQSPLGLLEQNDGYALMIGCRESVTFMHVVEYSSGAHCLGVRNEEYDAILPSGKRVKLRGWGWRQGNCPALDHDYIFNYMRQHHTLAEMMLHRSHLMLFKLCDYRKAYETRLSASECGCKNCSILPRQVKRNVPSDWDNKNNCLLVSDAFTGDIY